MAGEPPSAPDPHGAGPRERPADAAPSAPIPSAESTAHDTIAEAKRARRWSRGAGEDERPEPEPAPSEENPPEANPRPIPQARLPRARLSQLHLFEASLRRPSRRPEPPSPGGIELQFVRSLDRSQRSERVGSCGVRVTGRAHGTDARGRRATLGVGIDGLGYSVPIGAGFTPRQSLDALALRLDAKFLVEVEEEGPLAASLRVNGPR